MENSSNFIKLAAATIIAATIISIIMFISSMLNSSANRAASNTIKLINEITNYDIAKYDGREIDGDEVRYLLEKLKNSNVYLRVITKGNPAGFTNQIGTNNYDVHAFDNIYYRDSNRFINGDGLFKVTLGYDANNTFYGIMFQQV